MDSSIRKNTLLGIRCLLSRLQSLFTVRLVVTVYALVLAAGMGTHLMAATYTYKLLGDPDHDGNLTMVFTTTNTVFGLPDSGKSGFVTAYSYYKADNVSVTDGVYTITDRDATISDLTDINDGDIIYVTYDYDHRLFDTGDNTNTFRIALTEHDDNHGNNILHAKKNGIFANPHDDGNVVGSGEHPELWIITGDPYSLQIHPYDAPTWFFVRPSSGNPTVKETPASTDYSTFMLLSNGGQSFLNVNDNGIWVENMAYDWQYGAYQLTANNATAYNSINKRIHFEKAYGFKILNSGGKIVAETSLGWQGLLPTHIRAPQSISSGGTKNFLTKYSYYSKATPNGDGTYSVSSEDLLHTESNNYSVANNYFDRLAGSILGLGGYSNTLYVTYEYNQDFFGKVYTISSTNQSNNTQIPYWGNDDNLRYTGSQKSGIDNPTYWRIVGDPYEFKIQPAEDDTRRWVMSTTTFSTGTPVKVTSDALTSSTNDVFMMMYSRRSTKDRRSMALNTTGNSSIPELQRIIVSHDNVFYSRLYNYKKNNDAGNLQTTFSAAIIPTATFTFQQVSSSGETEGSAVPTASAIAEGTSAKETFQDLSIYVPEYIYTFSTTIDGEYTGDLPLNVAHKTIYVKYETPKCAKPTITFNYEDSKVTITSTVGATIYYTTNGSTPTTSLTPYSEAFIITEPTTVKAFAVKEGLVDSDVAEKEITRVPTPTIAASADGTAIEITCEMEGVTIFYTTDGSTPTISSAKYTGSLTEGVTGTPIKAIAVKDGFLASEIADIGSNPITLKCTKPIITRVGKSIRISCTVSTATIKYTIGEGGTLPTDPDRNNETYSEMVDLSAKTLPVIIKAYAYADGYEDSEIAGLTISSWGSGTAADPFLIGTDNDLKQFATDVNDSEEYAAAFYRLVANVSASGTGNITRAFTGALEGGVDEATGQFYTISNLSHALFDKIDGGTVKNIVLKDVTVSGNGAIANTATGDTRIYNCGVLSGSITGSGNVGSLVGTLDGNARVINCYSYATVSGGTWAGGIVGYNSTPTTQSNIATSGMVMNCMFYGDITSGTNIAPVFGGEMIANNNSLSGTALNTYNYYLFNSDYSIKEKITTYNCALAAQERNLTRFEFYRNLLNSNRELAAWYATGSTGNATSVMAKWVLDKTIAPYPILKVHDSYPSIINYDAAHATAQAERNKGGLLGTLSVSISQGSGAPTGATIEKASLTLNITDKDEDNYNYNYYKVQLPYYNEVGTGNYTGNKVVTGWIITTISGGTPGTYKAEDSAEGYNFADRQCTNKDLFSESKRVFAQGGYFDVPEGVTAITIEPYWGAAVYLSDPNYDVVYNTSYQKADVTVMGTRYVNGQNCNINGSQQPVYTTFANALAKLTSDASLTVYDQAIVLVGNYHNSSSEDKPIFGKDADRSYTVMSADLNGDNEPDYSLINQQGVNSRIEISPIRFDFLNWIGLGMAQKVSSSATPNEPMVGLFQIKGWFEVTNTCIVYFQEFEYDCNSKTSSKAPLILMGGYVHQIFAQNSAAYDVDRTSYIHVGDNVYFEKFNNGMHLDKNNRTRRIPISVTGGEYGKFYLSGIWKASSPTFENDDAECYINGGKIGEFAGAGQEAISGNVTIKVDHADIESFFGGGINASYPIKGNISVTIANSHVGLYCGGPKFGNMQTGKTVTTTATGCTFGNFFGAGYGGTALYESIVNDNRSGSYYEGESFWNGLISKNFKRNYVANQGIAATFESEYYCWAGGAGIQPVYRIHTFYASLSTAQTNDVTSTLTGCTIKEDFYGGGSLGAVNGNVTSTLTDCTVERNVYGAGQSATIPTVDVYKETAFVKVPTYNTNVGLFVDPTYPELYKYTWANATAENGLSSSKPFNDDAKLIWTDVDFKGLGRVTGNVTLNIEGTTSVAGHVFGGGDESATTGSVQVNINGGTIAEDVYGGGNKANVTGNVEVNLHGGVVANAYGGGRGVQEERDADDNITTEAVAAMVDGNVTVDVNGTGFTTATTTDDEGNNIVTKGRVFGCNNLNGTPTGAVDVHVHRTVNPADGNDDSKPERGTDTYEIEAVYGGGNLAAYLPTTNQATHVTVDGCGLSSIRYVYGGGNAAPVPATDVTVNGSYEIDYVFGGGNGKDRIRLANGNGEYQDNPGADVGLKSDGTSYGTDDVVGTTTVTIIGGVIHYVFGGSNTKGNVTKKANVILGDEDLEACEFTVGEVYGAGNEAFMTGDAGITLRCIEGLDEIYGGSRRADVQGNVELTISSGTYHRVFGGNNESGNIMGTVTVNIEETGCLPIIIDELYGVGNQAAYSVYGYEDDGHGAPLTESATPLRDPHLNVISATRIGTIYGGGLGSTAVVYGNPHVNINMNPGMVNGNYVYEKDRSNEGNDKYVNGGTPIDLPLGEIGTVFGGGNEARVVGNTYVHIGTGKAEDDSATKGRSAQITGNVYGGGNNADVTGHTEVKIGTEDGE